MLYGIWLVAWEWHFCFCMLKGMGLSKQSWSTTVCIVSEYNTYMAGRPILKEKSVGA